MVEEEHFVKQCKDAYQYMASLMDRIDKGEQVPNDEMVNQLSSVVEELSVAGEELSQQAEELVLSRNSLATERQHYQDLFDLAPDAYLVTDKEGMISECNLAAATMLQRQHEHLISKPLSVFVAQTEQKSFRSHLEVVSNDKKSLVHEWQMLMQPRESVQFPALMTARATFDSISGAIEIRWLIHDITKQKSQEEERKLLLERLVSTHEDVRSRISRELHDQMAQYLTALGIGLQSIRNAEQSTDTVQSIDKLIAITNEIGRAVHQIASELRPAAIDNLGLAKALSNYVQEWSEQTGIAVTFLRSGKIEPNVSPEIKISVYRIVQQALTNILKHANASHVSVILDRQPDQLDAIVEDNGIGFDVDKIMHTNAANRSLGLLGMKERAALVGGTLEIESNKGSGKGKGTTVFVRIPLPELANNDMEG